MFVPQRVRIVQILSTVLQTCTVEVSLFKRDLACNPTKCPPTSSVQVLLNILENDSVGTVELLNFS